MADASRAGTSETSGATGRDDDFVLPFRTEQSRLMGRVIRLGGVVDTILKRHDNPEPVSIVLGEALALAGLLGASLKPDSRLTLQTRGDGPIGFLVVNLEKPADTTGARVRGYASLDAERWSAATAGSARPAQGALLGTGHLALTIDPGGNRESYQGIVTLDGSSLTDAALGYFRQSEQLPTFLRLAVARMYTAGTGGAPGGWTWRAGGLLLQSLVAERGAEEDDESWRRACHLAATVEDHELVDPRLTSERLLYRLFHEEGVRVSPVQPVDGFCRCSQTRVEALMQSFGPDEMESMRDADGVISVTCEFCNTRYVLGSDVR